MKGKLKQGLGYNVYVIVGDKVSCVTLVLLWVQEWQAALQQTKS